MSDPTTGASGLIDSILIEAAAADRKFGPFTSTHEAYGVLAEEVLELLEAIRANDRDAVAREAIQVSAVAMRLAECCERRPFMERSGFAVRLITEDRGGVDGGPAITRIKAKPTQRKKK